MKIRIQHREVRLRLERREIPLLLQGNQIVLTLQTLPDYELNISLRQAIDSGNSARFSGNKWEFAVSAADLNIWLTDVGHIVSFNSSSSETNPTTIILEVDLKESR